MALTLEEFTKRYKLGIKQMYIEPGTSRFPRTILIPECPKCGNYLFLYNAELKPDPFIGVKVRARILENKIDNDEDQWLVTCWTDDCDFFIRLDENELARCPECNRYCMEKYALYDHMRFQCTRKAAAIESLRKVGVDMYIGGLDAV